MTKEPDFETQDMIGRESESKELTKREYETLACILAHNKKARDLHLQTVMKQDAGISVGVTKEAAESIDFTIAEIGLEAIKDPQWHCGHKKEDHEADLKEVLLKLKKTIN